MGSEFQLQTAKFYHPHKGRKRIFLNVDTLYYGKTGPTRRQRNGLSPTPFATPFKFNLKFPPPDLDCSVRKLTFAALEPAKPLNDAQMSGSFFISTSLPIPPHPSFWHPPSTPLQTYPNPLFFRINCK